MNNFQHNNIGKTFQKYQNEIDWCDKVKPFTHFFECFESVIYYSMANDRDKNGNCVESFQQ